MADLQPLRMKKKKIQRYDRNVYILPELAIAGKDDVKHVNFKRDYFI
jgi:hypothetical protein